MYVLLLYIFIEDKTKTLPIIDFHNRQ